MDRERCGRKKPAIIARIRDGLLSIKKAHSKQSHTFETISDVTIKIFVVSFCYVSVN
jgi:hypothetical protein